MSRGFSLRVLQIIAGLVTMVPAAVRAGTAILVVHGTVIATDGTPVPGLMVVVTNVTRGTEQRSPDPTDAAGAYSVTFLDFADDVAAADDELLIQLLSGEEVLAEASHVVSEEEIAAFAVVVDIATDTDTGGTESETSLLVVQGTVSDSIGTSFDGFTVSIEHAARAWVAEAVVGADLPNQYSAVEADFFGDSVAATGETLVVTLYDADGATRARVENTLTAADVNGSIATVDLSAALPQSPTLRVISPASGQQFPADTTSIAVLVEVSDHTGSWRWRLDVPFAKTGPTGGQEVADGNTADVDGLTPGTDHTLHVTLTDEGGNVVDPALTLSIPFSVQTRPPTLSIATPSNDVVLSAGTAATELRVVTTDHTEPWNWRLNSPFPNTGPAGGVSVVDSDTATVSGLADGLSYTVYVTLVDVTGRVLDAALTQSVGFSIDKLDPPTFAKRNSWMNEPDPNTRNEQADPGERVLPRVRLINDGPEDAQNVVVTLTIVDPDVTVVSGTVTHATWPAGDLRNNDGFVLDIDPGATSHDVDVTVDVTADNGGPWQFSFTIPVVGPALTFTERNSWIFEPGPDTRNGQADPGERVLPRVRLINDGPEDAQNVVVTLTIVDPDVTVVSGTVTHATWPAGDLRNNDGFVLDIDPGATSHDVDVTVDVTADNGGPWQFSFTVPVVAALPTLDIVTPAPGEELPAGTTVTDLRIAISGHAEPWHWRLNSPFPASGPAGGEANVSPAVATMGGLEDGQDYTVYVTLVDADDNVLDSTLTTSVRFTVASLPTLDIIEPADNTVLAAGSSSTQVTVAMADHPGTWHWQLDSDFPVAGPAGGTKVSSGPTATVDGLRNGESYVLFVTLVDPSGAVLAPTSTKSVRISVADWPPVGIALKAVDNGTRHPKLEVLVDEGSQVAAFSVQVDYDADMFVDPALAAIAVGSAVTSINLTRVPNTEGQITITGTASPGLPAGAGETVLFALEFSAEQVDEDDSEVHVSNVTLADSAGNAIGVTSIDPSSVDLETSRDVRLLGKRVETWGLIKQQAGVPSETALLANYPNPFNPETWIPFELSADADVTVTIYDVLGQVVRRMDLGLLAPGVYRTPSRAARWDGRNGRGVEATSGTYFVELRARGFRQVRRVVLMK